MMIPLLIIPGSAGLFGCDKDFQKEPEKFLQKIAAAAGKK